jgi:SAM-dependent methyltransferase
MIGAPDRDIRCPLTGSTDIGIVQEIPARYLIDRYRRDLGIDVSVAFHGVDSIAFCESNTTGLKFFSPPVTGAADMYAGLRKQGWYDPADKFEFSVGAAAVKPGDRVLDVGCGAGHFAQHVPEADYVGHDADSAGQGEGERAATLSGDLAGLAKDHAESFDDVTVFQVLEHAADPVQFTRDCLALLKPGGKLVIGVPDSDSYLGELRNFVLNAPPHHVTWWNAKSLIALAAITGLEDPVLHTAPVEVWEARLYWMARFQRGLTRRNAPMFEVSRRGRIVTVAAYLLAGLAERFLAPQCRPRRDHGAGRAKRRVR